MTRTATISRRSVRPKKVLSKKSRRENKREKVRRFVVAFYAEYGQMMSKLSNE